MRILQVSSARTFGGGEKHFVDLARGLSDRGHEVFAALRPTNEWQNRLDFIPQQNFLFVSIRNSFGMFSAKRIGRFIEQQQIDVVHAHVARDYLAASLATRTASRAKLVLTRHVVFPMKSFHRLALRNVAAAIAVSQAVERELRTIFPPEKVHLVLNGIATRPGSSSAEAGHRFREFHGIPPDVPVIATVGELRPLKGQRDFVLAANEILKRLPECRFVIAGQDHSIDKKFRRELKRLARVLGHEDKFLWLDWVDDLSELLAAADLFVSPSHSESFGLAILEAMAAGRAVVATETDGARQLIADRNALVPIKDPLELADRICRYIESDDARQELAATLERCAHRDFGLDRMVEATEKIYRSLLQSGISK